MNSPEWLSLPARGSRHARHVAACVQRLEPRCLLTLQISPIAAVAGQFFDVAVATFSDGDVQGNLADFQADIFWPGASSLITGGLIAPNGPGNYVIFGSNVYPNPGSFPVNVV